MARVGPLIPESPIMVGNVTFYRASLQAKALDATLRPAIPNIRLLLPIDQKVLVAFLQTDQNHLICINSNKELLFAGMQTGLAPGPLPGTTIPIYTIRPAMRGFDRDAAIQNLGPNRAQMTQIGIDIPVEVVLQQPVHGHHETDNFRLSLVRLERLIG